MISRRNILAIAAGSLFSTLFPKIGKKAMPQAPIEPQIIRFPVTDRYLPMEGTKAIMVMRKHGNHILAPADPDKAFSEDGTMQYIELRTGEKHTFDLGNSGFDVAAYPTWELFRQKPTDWIDSAIAGECEDHHQYHQQYWAKSQLYHNHKRAESKEKAIRHIEKEIEARISLAKHYFKARFNEEPRRIKIPVYKPLTGIQADNPTPKCHGVVWFTEIRIILEA